MLELWKTWTLLERLLVQEEHQRWFEGKTQSKNADAHNLDSKPPIAEPEVEIDEFITTYLNVDALHESEKVRGSEWIKIGVDTGAGKTARPQSITYGTMIPGDSDLTFRIAISGFRGVQAPVCKPLLSVGEYTTKGGVTVLYGDKGYMFLKDSNVAKKIDAWVQKELRDSQYQGCTVANKENNVHNICVKPRENKIDAMPLSGDSESGRLPAGSEPVRPENPEVPGGARDPEVPARARDPMRDERERYGVE